MNIQAKLAYTYITLLSIGVIVISSYAILSIRSFLLEEGFEKFESDAHSFANSFKSISSGQDLYDKVELVANLTGYEVALFDSLGFLIAQSEVSEEGFVSADEYITDEIIDSLSYYKGAALILNKTNPDKLIAFKEIEENKTTARYLRISELEKDIYAAESSIRHLIYGAMVSSILVVIIVSFFFARYLARPLLQLNEGALDIASGNLDRELNVNRNDEFGTLAASLNKMAERLKADNEQLKNVNKKQSQFFADITHEVRNPLHSISGALEMLELPKLEPEKKSMYVKVAQKQVHRVVRIFEDIKSLQRYDFDENFINKRNTSLIRLIDDVIGVNEPFAQEKNLELGVERMGSSQVFADPDKIEQVLDNLVSNAIKYTNKGKIRISCVEGKNSVEVTVTDTGIGIGEEHLDRLFDRFYRTDKARSRDKGGTGLGLAIVKSILNAHGSDIFVKSMPGVGTKFYFYLPKATKN